jgi:hypothetical protein
LERLVVADVESDEARSQPETSLTADTALAIEALRESGLGIDEPPVAAGLRWLVDHRLQPAQAGHNPRELAALLRAFTCVKDFDESSAAALPPYIQVAAHRSPRWAQRANRLPAIRIEHLGDVLTQTLRRQQQPDGGWSPWDWPSAAGADANLRAQGVIRACIRRSSAASAPDATGATLEMFAREVRPATDAAIVRGCAFLRSAQRGDGSWHGAAGTQLIHGTTWAIRGLIAAGVTAADPAIAAGVNWLLVHQRESGGWGEAGGSSASAGEFLAAEATAIQTAGAVLALVAAGLADHDATRRAIQFLVDRQRDDGAWVETQLTERDSAVGGWYRNDLHSSAATLLALARWAVAIGQPNHHEKPTGLRLVCGDL